MEVAFCNNGYIFGVDEAGRGSLAGPLVVCALAAPLTWGPSWIKDSKKYNSHEARKKALANLQADENLFWTVRWIDPQRIDEDGINVAQKAEMANAIEVLFYMLRPIHQGYPERIIVDGTWDNFFDGAEYVVDADNLFPAVSAASVVAKTSHDEYMLQLSALKKYAGYGFEKHMGYDTKEHREMIELLGVSSVHRRSFAPIQKFVAAGLIADEYNYINGPTHPPDVGPDDAGSAKPGRGAGRGSTSGGRKTGSRPRKGKSANTTA